MAASTAATASQPELRVRNNTPVIVVSVLVLFAVVMVGLFAGVIPMSRKIAESNDLREQANVAAVGLRTTRDELEVKRDNIIEQYDAIALFSERYPNAPEQDTLYRDLQNSALFAGVNIESIATDYPEILTAENSETGSVVTPDQIVVGGTPTEGEEVTPGETPGETPGTTIVAAAPGTDIKPGDDDSYPLGTIPLSLNATLDGTRTLVDNVGTHYVSSPYLGFYTFGGETGRERLTMSGAVESTPAEINKAYLDTSGVSTAGWSTVFNPDVKTPPYRDIEDLGSVGTAELVALYPKQTATDTVAVPKEWATNNGYLPLPDVSQSALLIDEIHNSPGRAILVRFVSGSGTGIVLSGQQFILRELPPLPETIFGDLNEDGVIDEGNGVTSGAPDAVTPQPIVSPSADATN